MIYSTYHFGGVPSSASSSSFPVVSYTISLYFTIIYEVIMVVRLRIDLYDKK
jgi:hypothetical protein